MSTASLTHTLGGPLGATLTVNAVSSALTGVLLLAAGAPIAALISPAQELFGVSLATLCRGAGLFLIAFAALALAAARARPVRAGLVWEVIALDVAWVIGSIVLVELAWDSLTPIGRIAIAAVALWVAMFVVLQGRGLKRALR